MHHHLTGLETLQALRVYILALTDSLKEIGHLGGNAFDLHQQSFDVSNVQPFFVSRSITLPS